MAGTPREQLVVLMAAANQDEKLALREFSAFATTATFTDFCEKVLSTHERTVPGSHVDQILMSMLNVIRTVKSLGDEAVRTHQNTEVQAQAPDGGLPADGVPTTPPASAEAE